MSKIYIAKIYVSLVKNNLRTLDSIPKEIREDVKRMLNIKDEETVQEIEKSATGTSQTDDLSFSQINKENESLQDEKITGEGCAEILGKENANE